MDRDRWWVFDKPLHRDPLFVIGLLAGGIAMVATLQRSDEMGAGAIAITVVGTIPSALLAVGIVLGSVREFTRARQSS